MNLSKNKFPGTRVHLSVHSVAESAKLMLLLWILKPPHKLKMLLDMEKKDKVKPVSTREYGAVYILSFKHKI